MDPRMGMGMSLGAGTAGGMGGIYEWLKNMAMQKAGQMGGSPYAGPQAPMGGPQAYAGMPPAPGPTRPSTPMPPAPGPAGPPTPMPSHGAPPPPPTLMPSHGITTPQTKTEQRAPLQFSWGGNAPQDYQPGITDVLSMEGAPAGREGFMGQTPDDPSRGGGFVASQPWENVANPQGFEGFHQAQGVQEALKGLEDPLWRERATADIEQARDLGVATGTLEKQAEILREEDARIRREIGERAEKVLAAREMEKGVPLTPEEQDDIYNSVALQYMGPQAGGMMGR